MGAADDPGAVDPRFAQESTGDAETDASSEPSHTTAGVDRLVVVGASAGGVEALQRLVRNLPSSFPAPVVVVLHMPPTGISRLPEILTRAGALPARHAWDGAELGPGVVYVAPPDRHVICSDHRLTLVEGPRENGVRPAVDPLFRSAARTFRDGVIAVVLSGTLDDGTAGVAAIKSHGGIAIVQDPTDAICPGMPLSAIENADVDYVAPAHEISDLLVDLLGRDPAIGGADRPRARVAGGASVSSDFVCPECGGVLRMFDENGVFRFHCRVGHNYSPEALYGAQDARLEAALWAAIRSLEESASLARRLAQSARERGATMTAQRFDIREQEAAERADVIRSAILNLSQLDETPRVGEPEPVSSEDDVVEAFPGTHMGEIGQKRASGRS